MTVIGGYEVTAEQARLGELERKARTARYQIEAARITEVQLALDTLKRFLDDFRFGNLNNR